MSLPYRLHEPNLADPGDGGNVRLMSSGNDFPYVVDKGPIYHDPTCYVCEVNYPEWRSQTMLMFNMGGQAHNTVVGRDYWMGWTWYISENWKPHYFESDPDGETQGEQIMQLHQSAKDQGTGGGITAPICIKPVQEKLVLRVLVDHKKITQTPINEIHLMTLVEDLTRYREHHLRIVMNWNYHHANGYIRVWINDELMADKRNGCGFNQTRGPTINPFMIYLATWKKEQSFYADGSQCRRLRYRYDALTVYGPDGSFDLVNPPKKTAPPPIDPPPDYVQEAPAAVVQDQLNDEDLWAEPDTEQTAYVQDGLKRLHDSLLGRPENQ